MAVWFTSDTHYSHKNVIKYCSRPFLDTEQMNNAMIFRWNSRVKPDDHVYHLGDFAFCPAEEARRIRGLLQGRVTLIRGNHDRMSKSKLRSIFDDVMDEGALLTEVGIVHMRHRPLAEDEPFGPYAYRLCGHVHEKWKNRGAEINVGVDKWGFYPVDIKELTDGVPPNVSTVCPCTK